MSDIQQDSVPAAAMSKTESLQARAESTAVGQIMTRDVVCLGADTPVAKVTEMFLERGISSAPVVDSGWRPQGIVSKTDLLKALVHDDMSAAAGDIVRIPGSSDGARATGPYLLSLHADASVSVAAALMAYEGVHSLPVVASDGQVIGMISTLDIVRWIAKCADLDVSAGA